MSRLLRTVIKIISALGALLLLSALLVLYVTNPNRHRAAIEQAVLETSGLRLDIAGELSLSFRPYLAITLGDVRLRNAEQPRELASSGRVILRVDPARLLRGELLVRELRTDDLHLNWYVDDSGTGPWSTARGSDVPGGSNTATAAAAANLTQDTDSPLFTSLDLLSVNNASVDIQDLQRGYSYRIRALQLSSRATNFRGQPFDTQSSFEIVDPAGAMTWPLAITGTSRVDLDQGTASIERIRMTLTPMLLEGSVEFRQLFGDTNWNAQLESNLFSFSGLLQTLLPGRLDDRQPALPAVNQAMTDQARLRLGAAGDLRGIDIPELGFSIGSNDIQGQASLRFATGLAPSSTTLELRSGALDLTPYLDGPQPPPAAPLTSAALAGVDPAAPATATPEGQLRVPRSLLAGMNLVGRAYVESLRAGDLEFGPINLFANLEGGILDVEAQPAAFREGTVAGNLRINSRPAQSEASAYLTASRVNLLNLALPVLEPGAVAGLLDLEAEFYGSGETLDAWLDGISGSAAFALADNSIDIGLLKQVFTAIAALSPTGEAIQQWPDMMRFAELAGYVILDGGTRAGQQARLRMDNFDIEGSGGFDPQAASFDYDLLFTVLGPPHAQTIPVSGRFLDVPWPVQCNARLDAPVNQFCRPDFPRVREIFLQPGGDGLPQSPEETVSAQAPEQLPERARDLLRNLFPY